MTRTRRRTFDVGLGVVALAFVAGILIDSWLRVYGPPMPRGLGRATAESIAEPTAPGESSGPASRIAATPPGSQTHTTPHIAAAAPVATSGHSGKLKMPIEGAELDSLKGGFVEARTGHQHEAVDILSPRNTPVHAVEDGTIAKLFFSKAGGNTIYEFDQTGRYAFYYAHLERYATGLREGETIAQGQIIGYVGTSGNAPPNTPHLHFAVFELGPERQWWKGKAIDPYQLFR
jgi:murein DD-endopeptidase MepM/ murein hydrolase activator NlpD